MQKKFLIPAILSIAIVGGVFAADLGAGLMEGNLAGVNPLTSTGDYTLTIDGDNPLIVDESTAQTTTGTTSEASGSLSYSNTTKDASITTKNGNTINFFTNNVAASEGSALNFTSYCTQSYSTPEIRNTTPINGIKKIKVTFEQSTNYPPRELKFAYGYTECTHTDSYGHWYALEYDMTHEYQLNTLGNFSGGYYQTVFEYDFIDEIAPNYFSLAVDHGNSWPAIGNDQKVSSIEITYSCSETPDTVSSVTVNSSLQLYQSVLYYRSKAPKLGGTINIGSDLSISRTVRFQPGSYSVPATINLNLNDHTITAAEGSDFYASDTRGTTMLAAGGPMTLTVKGNGTVNTNSLGLSPIGTYSGSGNTNTYLNIEGGTYEATSGRAAVMVQASSAYDFGGNVNISGGTFLNADGTASDNLIGFGLKSGGTVYQTGNVTVTGGTWTGYDPSSYVDGENYLVTSSTLESGVSQYVVSAKESTDVSSEAEFNAAITKYASTGGIINITSDFSYNSSLIVSGNITINGNSHTITPASGFTSQASPRNAALAQVGGTLYINNLTFDFINITDSHGIRSVSGDMHLSGVTVKNFGATAINSFKVAVYFYDRGIGSLTNCTVESAMGETAYGSYEYAEVWAGAGRTLTISGGSYGRIFINTNEQVSEKTIYRGSLILKDGAKADMVTADCEANKHVWTGTVDGTETEFAAGTLIHHADLTIGTDCSVATVVTNPNSLDVTATATDGVYSWSINEGVTGKYLSENVADLTYKG